MKKTLYFVCGILMSLGLGFSAKANSSGNTCFTDVFGYVWKVSYTGDQSGNFQVSGTVDIGEGILWNVWGWANGKHAKGSLELHAIDPAPDGCYQYVDSFLYYGTASIDRSNGLSTYGTGTWESFCGRDVYNSGTWEASGPCQASAKQVNPAGPARHNSSTQKKTTNTVCFNDGFYNWTITYTGTGNGSYSATGTVNVDGINWTVYGWGGFANHAGTVELHASNPYADGCQGAYTDSFTYAGTAQITGNGSGTTFSGSGDWTSYCSGNIYNAGTWSAYGPCSNLLKAIPYGPAKHGDAFVIKVSPNPMRGSSAIVYNLAKESKVSITVYNYMQQPVKVIVNKTESAGRHSYIIDGTAFASGVYRVVAIVDGRSYTTSLQVVK